MVQGVKVELVDTGYRNPCTGLRYIFNESKIVTMLTLRVRALLFSRGYVIHILPCQAVSNLYGIRGPPGISL